MKKNLSHWAPVLLYTALIFVFSSFPVAVSAGTDKLLHILEYSLMGFLVTRAILLTWNLKRISGAVLGGLLGGALGACDEIHQKFVPGRFSSVGDGLADLIGAFLGAVVFILLGTVLYRSQKLYPRHDKCC